MYYTVVDPEGVPWVPWNPAFEGLPSKLLCATHVCQLNNLLYQELDARMAYVHV